MTQGHYQKSLWSAGENNRAVSWYGCYGRYDKEDRYNEYEQPGDWKWEVGRHSVMIGDREIHLCFKRRNTDDVWSSVDMDPRRLDVYGGFTLTRYCLYMEDVRCYDFEEDCDNQMTFCKLKLIEYSTEEESGVRIECKTGLQRDYDPEYWPLAKIVWDKDGGYKVVSNK